MKRKLLLALGCLVGLATLSYGGHVWYKSITYVSTDDAYVEGTISPVSAKVAGHIVELFVQDNQAVKQGDVLLRVDPRDFQAKREQARAAVATAQATLRAARSEVPLTREGTRAQIDQARAALEAAVVGVGSAGSAGEESRRRLALRPPRAGRRGIARPARGAALRDRRDARRRGRRQEHPAPGGPGARAVPQPLAERSGRAARLRSGRVGLRDRRLDRPGPGTAPGADGAGGP